MTEKMTKVQSEFAADISDLQKASLILAREIFKQEIDTPPVISVATHAGASLETCRYDTTIETKNGDEKAFFIVLNGSVLADTRRTLELISHNIIHLIQIKWGVMPKISHPRFNEVAKRFGMVANYTDKNHGYSDVRFTNETWEKIQPLFNGLNFRTVVKSTEKTTDKKPAKKGKYTYISPNGLDFVVSDSDKLELFSPVGENKIMRVWTLADKVALQALYARRRDEKRKRPIPESRGKVIK